MLLNQNKARFYDPIRKKTLSSQPEERVRQDFISFLIHLKGFAANLLSIEVSLSDFPHLSCQKVQLPNRRVDIVAYAKGLHHQHSLYPLLLVECKDKAFGHKPLQQLKGYNAFIQAPYIALVNGENMLWGFYNPNKACYEMGDLFPEYKELIQRARNFFSK